MGGGKELLLNIYSTLLRGKKKKDVAPLKLAGFGNSNGIFNTALQLSTYQHAQGLIPFPKCLLRVLHAEAKPLPAQ